ncbi:hypothetical protein BH20ACT21_BH20ACT21_10580 [soil metagenome]
MQGDFSAGRELVSSAHGIYEDLGMKIGAAMGACEMAWFVELPQDPAEAEKKFRHGYELLEEMGETAMRSSVAGYLSHALVRLDRIDEAERFTIISEQLASLDDYISQTSWRSARAHIYARRGWMQEAIDLAREAVLLTEPTSDLNRRADCSLTWRRYCTKRTDLWRLPLRPPRRSSSTRQREIWWGRRGPGRRTLRRASDLVLATRVLKPQVGACRYRSSAYRPRLGDRLHRCPLDILGGRVVVGQRTQDRLHLKRRKARMLTQDFRHQARNVRSGKAVAGRLDG